MFSRSRDNQFYTPVLVRRGDESALQAKQTAHLLGKGGLLPGFATVAMKRLKASTA